MKKRYNFTLDEDTMAWIKVHCKDNRTNCSAFINQLLLRVKQSNTKSKMSSISTKLN